MQTKVTKKLLKELKWCADNSSEAKSCNRELMITPKDAVSILKAMKEDT